MIGEESCYYRAREKTVKTYGYPVTGVIA